MALKKDSENLLEELENSFDDIVDMAEEYR